MAEFSERLKEAMQRRGMTQAELCARTNIPRSAMSQYVSGVFRPKQERAAALADALNVNEAWLLGVDVPMTSRVDNLTPLFKIKRVPLIGRIACGAPILAEQNIDGAVLLPDNMKADFALRCKGDSMINARIFDGDIVYIKQQSTVENGEIAAVLIGEEATLKRVYFDEEGSTLRLVAENPAFKTLVFSGSALQDVSIIGKAVGFTSFHVQ